MDIKAVKPFIQPLTFMGQSLSSSEQAYSQFYGIDFDNKLADINHEFGYLDIGHYRIACHAYCPKVPKGTFFLLHGYYDHVGLFRHIIEYLLKQGYCVFAYDLPGHGLSSGQPATIPDFSIYSLVLEGILKECSGHLPKPWHAYGQSTGCAIITDFLAGKSGQQKEPAFKKVILSAPLVRPYLWGLGKIQLYVLRLFLQQIPRKFTDNSRDHLFLEFAKADPLAPRVLPVEWVNAMARWINRIEKPDNQIISICPLILQGTEDTTIDAKHNIAVLSRLYKDPQVLYLEGARHHLPNELEPTRTEYMQWLSSHL